VPVAVGLDDRHDVGCRAGPQRGDIRPDRGEIDDSFGTQHAVQSVKPIPALGSQSLPVSRPSVLRADAHVSTVQVR
jgi:hypothetical protein